MRHFTGQRRLWIYQAPYLPEVKAVERARRETAAKVPLQASENARERHGKGVELDLHAFLQQSRRRFGGMWRGGCMGV